jgi:hypothetical protein
MSSVMQVVISAYALKESVTRIRLVNTENISVYVCVAVWRQR